MQIRDHLTLSSFGCPCLRSRGLYAAVAGVLGVIPLSFLAAGAAWGQSTSGLLPATGIGGRGDDLRGSVSQFLPNALASIAGRAWEFAASLGVEAGVTDSPGGTSRSGGFDFFTLISPSVSVTGSTSRVTVRLDYSPEIAFYANTPGQNRVSQNLNGSLNAVIVPETFFLDLRGNISEQSRFGGNQFTNGQQNSQFLSRENAIQSTTVSASPSLQHRFGGWGTGRLSYTIARTLQDSANSANQFSGLSSGNSIALGNLAANQQGFGTTGNLTTQRERASFTTGENLGRFNDEVTVEAVQYNGSGSYHGAYRNSINNGFSYAVTRAITLLAGVGYQDLRFGGPFGYRLSEPTWNVGTRLTPNADSSLTITYGRREGDTTFAFDGAYSPTPRTRIVGRYSTGVTADIEEQQNLLQTTRVGAGGLLVDNGTGAPVTGGSAFGTQNGLSRVKRLSFTAFLLLDRDTFAATVTTEDRTTLTNSTSFVGTSVPAGTSNSSVSGSLSWQRDLNRTTSLSSAVSYGVSNNGSLLGNPAAGAQNTFSVSTSLGHTFTETLTGSVRYSYTDRTGGQGNNLPTALGGSATQNLLLVGLRKSF